MSVETLVTLLTNTDITRRLDNMETFEAQKKKFLSWIDKVDPKEQIGIIAHAKCNDGMTSVVFLVEALKKKYPLMPKPHIVFLTYGLGRFDDVVRDFKEKEIKKIFVLDVSLNAENVDEFKRFCGIFTVYYIDHHPWDYKLNMDNVIKTESADCTSLTLYKFCEGLIDYKKWSWLVCATLVSEFSYKKAENLIFLQSYYPSITIENVRDSEPYLISNKIGSTVIYYKDDTDKAYQLVHACDLKKLQKIHDEVYAEMQKNLKDFEATAKPLFNKNLFFYHLDSKFSLASKFATILSIKHSPATIIVFSVDGDDKFIKVSARNNTTPLPYSMSDLLKAGMVGLNETTSGGHPAASGGVFLKKDIETFKKQVTEFVKEKLKA